MKSFIQSITAIQVLVPGNCVLAKVKLHLTAVQVEDRHIIMNQNLSFLI